MFDGEHFWHRPCAKFSAAKFSDDGQNSRLPNPYCGAQFTCRNAAAIPNRHINSVFGLRRRCHVWSIAARPVTTVVFTVLKTTDPASNWANIYGILTIHASQKSMNLYRTEPSAERNLITSFGLIRQCTTSAILHRYCVERMGLIGAPMILVQLDSVANW